jgi:hypothetical protein
VNPETVYSSLTGILGGGSGAIASEADYRVKRGQSAIDLVRGDLSRLQRLDMSRADQQRIADWLDLLRETEVGIGVGSCSAAQAEELGVTPETVAAASDASLATSFTLGGDMMMNLMALSMICDTNRSLILTYPGYVVFDWDGISHTHDHSGLSHRTGDLSVGGACLEHVIAMILEIDRWYATKFARLVGLLDGIEEGSGTLLDNTATMWLNELSDGAAHNLNNLPILIAGGAGGYLKQGYAVNVEGKPIGLGNSSSDCANGTTGVTSAGSTGGNVPINKLYVTLMNAVGCTADATPTGAPIREFGQFDGLTTDSGITDPGEVEALTA